MAKKKAATRPSLEQVAVEKKFVAGWNISSAFVFSFVEFVSLCLADSCD